MFGIRRREFITLLGSAATAWPLAAQAQQQAMRLTQSGHSGYSAATRPGAFTWEVILRRTMSM